jgi:hypothetical protein
LSNGRDFIYEGMMRGLSGSLGVEAVGFRVACTSSLLSVAKNLPGLPIDFVFSYY